MSLAPNMAFCESIRRIVQGIIASTDCSEKEAVQETADALGISEPAVLLALAHTNH